MTNKEFLSKLLRLARSGKNWKLLLLRPIVAFKILRIKSRNRAQIDSGLNPSESFFYQQYQIYKDSKLGEKEPPSDRIQGSITWVVVPVSAEGGGARTISRFIRVLSNAGIKQTILIWSSAGVVDIMQQKHIWHQIFQVPMDVDIQLYNDSHDCEFIIATAWQTAIPSMKLTNKARRLYFIQDDEKVFEPMGDSSNLVKLGLGEFGAAITAGPWLQSVARDQGISNVAHFGFGADPIYAHVPRNINNKIVAYYQPGKARRQAALLLSVVELVCSWEPGTSVELVGGGGVGPLNRKITNLGALSPLDLASRYHAASVGLVLSASNASLIPYEMRACGIPVVTNSGAHSEWLGENIGIYYENSDPIALAQKVIEVISNNRQYEEINFNWEKNIENCLINLSHQSDLGSSFPRLLKEFFK